jgi:hypothetical protein
MVLAVECDSAEIDGGGCRDKRLDPIQQTMIDARRGMGSAPRGF